MDFLEAKHTAAREIALAFGVPVRRGARFAVAVAGARVGIGLANAVIPGRDEVANPESITTTGIMDSGSPRFARRPEMTEQPCTI